MILELGAAYSFDITYRALVMGILNRTPDSFFDGGQYFDFDGFIEKADGLVRDGADFLDVGGVKAGPGPEVSTEEELERVVPAIAALRSRFDLPISVDTWNPVVLRESLSAGASVGNDISGFAHPDYLPICAEFDASVVATHIRLGPRIPDPEPVYENLQVEVRAFLQGRAEAALAAGIPHQRIMVDDGMDLGKTEPQSLELLRSSEHLASLGYATFLSASNKRFLGALLGTEVTDRRQASHAAHALGIAKGCRVLRAHDVVGARRTADILAALLQAHSEGPDSSDQSALRAS
ncbi:MAG: dihydropteroate synthase [Actinobacteria bacterium]|uniref:dihydropteroate synthase n=1 Tax=freshwater metagenome TaxID=449393 RepID=A0A6J7MND1_9ZZZZ|nr:dihydropteroate synthase [Actinomycetota bacterium]MTA75137.1 dihydropteroate synthase [Actinomycetota bacterium]